MSHKKGMAFFHAHGHPKEECQLKLAGVRRASREKIFPVRLQKIIRRERKYFMQDKSSMNCYEEKMKYAVHTYYDIYKELSRNNLYIFGICVNICHERV